MYHNGIFSGEVVEVERREQTQISGTVSTLPGVIVEENVSGSTHSRHITSYEFKLKGHNEIFYKEGRHIIVLGDKLIFEAHKDAHGYFVLGTCKNLTREWVACATGSWIGEIIAAPFRLFFSLLVAVVVFFFVQIIVAWLTPQAYEIYANYILVAGFVIAFVLGVLASIRSFILQKRIDTRILAMQTLPLESAEV